MKPAVPAIVTAARLVWGGALTAAPDTLLSVVTGRPATRSQRAVLRVLGTRHLVQALISALRPTRRVLAAGAAVDLLHVATCAGAALIEPEWRRPALVDGVCASGLAAGGLASTCGPSA